MSEFKTNPYIYFYPSDWLGDTDVRRLPGEVKGFYIDLICHLHSTFPYGYCSVLNSRKINKLQKRVNLKDNQEVNLRVELLLQLSVAEQLKIAENIESELNLHLPYTQDQITGYIRVLEERMIISRSNDGVLYVRRMVKDFKKRVVAYLNGSQGGNPGVKRGKYVKKEPKKTHNNLLKDKQLKNRVNRNVNQTGYPTADLIINTNNNIRKGGAGGEIISHEFPLQKIYDTPFEDLVVNKGFKNLTPAGFAGWKELVDLIVEKGWTELFICHFLKPQDFDDVVAKGFVRQKWEPVLQLILGSGILPHYNLFHRIPQYLGYYDKGVKQQQKGSGAAIIESKPDDHTFTPGE